MTKIINLKDLRLNMDDYISKVKKGDSFLVMRRSEQVFKISPFEFEEVDPKEDAKGWKTLVDFRKLTPDGCGIDANVLANLLRESIKRDEQNKKVSKQTRPRSKSKSTRSC